MYKKECLYKCWDQENNKSVKTIKDIRKLGKEREKKKLL